MCGIAGYYSSDRVFRESELQAMTRSLAHRGPDADGFFTDAIVGLGHRRLSIIDLSADANQPMTSKDGRYVIVYNGEVYNYREIAAELKLKFKSEFRTSSDTEIILEAYAKYGVAFLQKLNGMFAMAIYDKQEHEIFICRDRMGIKPLYYFWDGKNLAFGSELKALTQAAFIPKEIDHNSIYKFLHLGFIPAPQSIYKAIHKLEAGVWLKVSSAGIEKKQYWALHEQVKQKVMTNEKQAALQLSDLLMSSVQYQIKSDVPFGVFLSGGIDSSLVTRYAANLAGVNINTFSIGFEENRYNESSYAKAVANYLGTSHHEFIVSYKDAIDMIDTLFEAYTEPFADSSSIPTMLVSKLAKKHVTVTLSGEGGDELFLGYGAYKWAQRLNRPMVRSFRKPIEGLLYRSKSKYARHSSYFERAEPYLQYSHILSQEQYFFSMLELKKVLTHSFLNIPSSTSSESIKNFGIEVDHLKRELTHPEKQALFDLHFYLPYDLLTKVDRASMNFSLETRVPYLDHRIVEFALNLSPELKYKNGVSKYILKEILFNHIPEKFFKRPKQGFAVPMEKWLKKELRFLIEDLLDEKTIEKYGIVNYKEVHTLKEDFMKGKNHLYNRLWVLIVLHKWLIKNCP